MTTSVDLLQQIGFNKYEAGAYYTLLTHGALTGYEVGKYSHVPGSRSYEVLERLLEKGLALVQPGEPPRYTAQDPHLVFDRLRSTMETTLTTLVTSLSSLAPIERNSEFWVVRGRQNILTQVRAMIAHAHGTLALVLPPQYDIAESLTQAKARGCHIIHTATHSEYEQLLLLICDEQEALVGTLSPLDSCQSVVGSNAAFLAALRGYFSQQHLLGASNVEQKAETPRHFDGMWLDWEAHKQDVLRNDSYQKRISIHGR